MSLLNQVLRDLQGRQAVLPLNNMQGQIRPVSPQSRKNYLFLVVLGIALLFVAGWYYQHPVTAVSIQADDAFKSAVAIIPPAPAISPPITKPAMTVVTESRSNRVAAVRLNDAGGPARLVLEFSRANKSLPEVSLTQRTLKIMLPEIQQDVWQLPSPHMGSALIGNLAVSQKDQGWVMEARLNAEAQYKTLILDADGAYGERLVIDITPLKEIRTTTGNKNMISREVRAVPAAERVNVPSTVTKQKRILSARESAEEIYLKGVATAKGQRPQEAMQYWEQALRLFPEHLNARKQLILALLPHRRNQADALFSEGLLLHDAIMLRKWYARALLPVVGAAQAAVILNGQSISVEKNEEYLSLQSGLWQQAGDYPRSEQGYRRLIQNYPDNSLYRFGLAVALDQQKKTDGALKSYNEALEGVLGADLRAYALNRVNALSSNTGVSN